MKKLLFILLSVFVLAACEGDVYEGDTAEDAVLNLQKDFVSNLTDLQLAQVDDEQQVATFKAVIEKGTEAEVFAALVIKKEGKWRVQEALAIGHQDTKDLEPAKGSYVEGEVIDSTTDDKVGELEDGYYVFDIADSDHAVKIRLTK